MNILSRLNSIHMCVLAAIRNEDSYGYKILTDLRPYVNLPEATLYTTLKRLKENELLEVKDVEFDGRLRRYYHITQKGIERFEEFKNDLKELFAFYQFIMKDDLKQTDND